MKRSALAFVIFSVLFSGLVIGVTASAQELPVGKFQAIGTCHFDFGYGNVYPGSGREPFLMRSGWYVTDVVVDWAVSDYPTSATTKTQYATFQPFETRLEEYVTRRDYPNLAYPYAGPHTAVQFGLKANPAEVAHHFPRLAGLKLDYQLSIRGDKIRLSRYGTANHRGYQLARNFSCDLTVIAQKP